MYNVNQLQSFFFLEFIRCDRIRDITMNFVVEFCEEPVSEITGQNSGLERYWPCL